MGGSGFIGSSLCRALIGRDGIVRSFARSVPPVDSADHEWQRRVEWVCGDFSDAELVCKSLRKIDVVFHLISSTIPATSNSDPRYDLSSNVLPTLQMLDLLKDSDVRKLIFVSSGGAIYGKPEQVPIPEDHATNPICAYGIQKLSIEKYLHLFHHLWKLDYAVVRPSNPYGVGQPVNRPQGAIANFMHKALRREPVEIWGDGRVIRDYIYIEDLIEACLLLIDHTGPSRVFNIGTGRGHTLLELVTMIENITREPMTVHFRAARSADVPANVLNISRALAELNWQPKTDIVTGLKEMFQNSVRLTTNIM
jgi:UDP-glucose 4-epimerase